MSTPQWETSKENIAPLATGRNVPTLTAALSKSAAVLKQERAEHHASIKGAASGQGPYSSDPLTPWVSYVKWALDNYPRGSDTVIAAVEGVCRTYSKDPRYVADRRFVRLWVRYADLRKDKLDVFEYMQRRHIGEKSALFYEAWATTLELARQYEECEAIYRLGIRLEAEPSSRLAQREREFFSRMGGRRRRAQKKAEKAAEKKAAAEKLAAASSRAGRGQNTLADRILSRPGHGDSADVEMPRIRNENAHPSSLRPDSRMERPALGAISERQAQSGRRPAAPVESRPVDGLSVSSGGGCQSNASSVLKRKADTIEVYADPTPGAESRTQEDVVRREENCPLPPIAKVDEVHKENNGGLPRKWAGETLPQDSNALENMQRRRRGGLAPRQDFQIYEDSAEDQSHQFPEPAPPVQSNSHLSPIPEHPPSPPPTRKSSARLSHPVSPTINTKIAMQEIEDMFSSALPVEIKRAEIREEKFSAQRRAVQKPKSTFEIFQDADGDKKENAMGVVEGSGTLSGNPVLENRVLKPLPELEGPYISVVDEDLQAGNEDIQVRDENMHPLAGCRQEEGNENLVVMNDAEDEATNELLDFLARWCLDDSTYFLLDGPSPRVEKNEMFDLHPKQNLISSVRGPVNPHSVVSFRADNVIWNGHDGNSIVVAVEDKDNVYELRMPCPGDNEVLGDLMAMKVSETSNAWEYYIYKILHDRYDATLKSVANAVVFYEGSPRTYMVLDSMHVSSLAKVMSFTEEKHFSESLAMFFTTDLLRTLEAIHSVGIIHCDVTLDNILFRNNHLDDLIEDRYVASGVGSWGNKGVLLVDFNHAVDSKQGAQIGRDMEALAALVTKDGNEFLEQDYRIPNAKSWSFNADCYAAAVCSSKMLGLSRLTAKSTVEGTNLKHERIWEVYFRAMESLSSTTKASHVIDTMRRCREEMEGALVEEKWLKSYVERLSAEVEHKFGLKRNWDRMMLN